MCRGRGRTWYLFYFSLLARNCSAWLLRPPILIKIMNFTIWKFTIILSFLKHMTNSTPKFALKIIGIGEQLRHPKLAHDVKWTRKNLSKL